MTAKTLTPPTVLGEIPAELTLEQLKAVMPARQKQNITPALVDELNQLITEPEYREQFRENILGYVSALQDPNTSLPGYIRAVKYVGYKLMGHTNQESWLRTFPERYQRLVDKNADDKYIRSLVCAYNKGKLVNQILEQSLVPTWVLNQDKFQKAINTQATLMITAKSEKVRTDAANSLLTHLKQPETAKVRIDMNVKQDDSITELKEVMIGLAKVQKEAIESGVRNAKDIAESTIIEGESERID